MQESTCEFHFHYNIPDEDTVHRINAVLASQKYSRLTISHANPTIVTETNYKADGTIDYERKTTGISEISFSGEMEEQHSGYDYRLDITLVSHSIDLGSERFRERWNRVHFYSTMCQMIQYKFEEGFVYIVLYHDGRSDKAVLETIESNRTTSKYVDEDSDTKFAAAPGVGIRGWKKLCHIDMEDDDYDT